MTDGYLVLFETRLLWIGDQCGTQVSKDTRSYFGAENFIIWSLVEIENMNSSEFEQLKFNQSKTKERPL